MTTHLRVGVSLLGTVNYSTGIYVLLVVVVSPTLMALFNEQNKMTEEDDRSRNNSA